MKKLLFVAILLATQLSYAQNSDTTILLNIDETYKPPRKKSTFDQKTLFGNNSGSVGGFGALTVNATSLNGEEALLTGFRAGVILDHGMAIGFGGHGLVTSVYKEHTSGEAKLQLEMGYGGLLFEPILAPKWPVHITLPVLIGAGGAVYTSSSDSADYWYDDYEVEDVDAFFVLEPGVNVEFNITRFFRLDVGASYRYLRDIDLINTNNKDLNGWSGGFTMKFGKF